MKKTFGDYRLLAKGNRQAGTLWQGPDHLLCIETAGFLASFTESYRRIDYKNIQSVGYARTRTGMWIAIVTSVFLSLLAWGVLANLGEAWGSSVFFGICAAPILLVLVVNLARGPTCVCKVQTAVQLLHLKPVNRMRKAARFVAQLIPLCTAHQGGQSVTAESLAAGIPAAGTSAAPDAGSLEMDASIKAPWTGLKLVTWAMALLVCSGIATIADVFIKNMAFFVLDCVLGIAAYVVSIAALARSARFERPGALKAALWGAMANCVVSIATGYGLLMWAVVTFAQEAVQSRVGNEMNYAMYERISNAGFDELGAWAWLLVGIGAAAVFLGLLGFPSGLRPAGRLAPGAPPPPRPAVPPVSLHPQP